MQAQEFKYLEKVGWKWHRKNKSRRHGFWLNIHTGSIVRYKVHRMDAHRLAMFEKQIGPAMRSLDCSGL